MAYLRHAGDCSLCSLSLREAAAVFAEESSPEEEAELDRLATSSATGQMRLAERLHDERPAARKVVVPKPARRFQLLFWPVGALAVAAALLVVFFVRSELRANSDAALLAKAYDKHRLTELRIPGGLAVALASPTRGRTPGDVASSELLKVKLRSQQAFEKDPNNPALRQTLGRIAIVEHDGETARRQFEMAEALDPKLPGLKFDLGTAYFEIAESTGRPLEYAHAIDYFGQYLHDVHQQDPVALFDQGLCWERENVDTEAIKDFEAALALEKDAGWRQEIGRHLQALKARDGAGASAPGAAAALTPASFLALRGETPGEFEAYLDASRDWLPRRNDDPETAAALRQLAALGTQHGDAWLADMLKQPLTPTEAEAERTLAASLAASAKGSADQALAASTAAIELFTQAGNQAGRLRAKAQHVYSLQILGRAKDALAEAVPLLQSGELARYAWQRVYLQLEVAACHSQQGEFALELPEAKEASVQARSYGLMSLDLRAVGSVVTANLYLGHLLEAWGTATSVLVQCYAHAGTAYRRFQLLLELELVAKALGLPWTQIGLAEAEAKAADASGNLQSAAYAYEGLGLTQLSVDATADARQSFESADQKLTTLGQGPMTSFYQADWKTDRATLEAREQGPQSALPALAAEETTFLKPERFMSSRVHFYTQYAELLQETHQPQASFAKALIAAGIAGQLLPTIHTEQERHAWIEQTSPAYRLLVRDLADTGHAEAALRSWEWFRSAPFRDPSQWQTTAAEPTAGEFLASLPTPPTGVLTLVYARVQDQYLAWSVSGDPREPVRLRVLPAAASAIESQGSAFHRLCEDPHSSQQDILLLGGVLSQSLLQPFQDQIDHAQYVQLDLDPSLSRIPFAALAHQENFFGLERPLIFLPPWWTLTDADRQTPPASQARLPGHARLLVVNSSSANAPGGIPEDYDESRDIVAQFPQAQLQPARLYRAGTDLIAFGGPALRPMLAEADLVHYSGHGLDEDAAGKLPEQQPGQAPVAIGPGTLKHCLIAVLSACRTLGEREDALEDDPSFERMVFSSGAAYVVGTRWDVDSAMTRKLMVRFYAGLAGRQTFAEALRGAQQALASDTPSSHPYFWSAFQLVGR
jgi:CHAT domain-containing protein